MLLLPAAGLVVSVQLLLSTLLLPLQPPCLQTDACSPVLPWRRCASRTACLVRPSVEGPILLPLLLLSAAAAAAAVLALHAAAHAGLLEQ